MKIDRKVIFVPTTITLQNSREQDLFIDMLEDYLQMCRHNDFFVDDRMKLAIDICNRLTELETIDENENEKTYKESITWR